MLIKILMMKMSLEYQKYLEFVNNHKLGMYLGQRFGQAFYNFFDLYKIADQSSLEDLYEKDGIEAIELINELFDFN